jgi:hypothetical protein
MENRITTYIEDGTDNRNIDAQPIGQILEELFAQYQAQFPSIKITVVETPVNAI